MLVRDCFVIKEEKHAKISGGFLASGLIKTSRNAMDFNSLWTRLYISDCNNKRLYLISYSKLPQHPLNRLHEATVSGSSQLPAYSSPSTSNICCWMLPCNRRFFWNCCSKSSVQHNLSLGLLQQVGQARASLPASQHQQNSKRLLN